MLPSVNTTRRMAAEGEAYQLLLHNGDISYARCGPRLAACCSGLLWVALALCAPPGQSALSPLPPRAAHPPHTRAGRLVNAVALLECSRH
jgi:hypothetical protein